MANTLAVGNGRWGGSGVGGRKKMKLPPLLLVVNDCASGGDSDAMKVLALERVAGISGGRSNKTGGGGGGGGGEHHDDDGGDDDYYARYDVTVSPGSDGLGLQLGPNRQQLPSGGGSGAGSAKMAAGLTEYVSCGGMKVVNFSRHPDTGQPLPAEQTGKIARY
jgi:hypothetical protein